MKVIFLIPLSFSLCGCSTPTDPLPEARRQAVDQTQTNSGWFRPIDKKGVLIEGEVANPGVYFLH